MEIPFRPWASINNSSRDAEYYDITAYDASPCDVTTYSVDTGTLRATEGTTFSANCRCFSAIGFEPVATSDRPEACQGCQNYHGETYNGNRLICGIHPYGWNDGDECRDRAEVN